MFKRIYVPLDNSDVSDKVLRKVIDLVEGKSDVVVKVVHVVNLEQVAYGIGFIGSVDLKDTFMKIGNDLLDHAKKLLADANIKSESALLEDYIDNVATLLIKDAEQFGADLIAVGSHRLGGFSHFISGGVVEDLTNHSEVPLLLVTSHH